MQAVRAAACVVLALVAAASANPTVLIKPPGWDGMRKALTGKPGYETTSCHIFACSVTGWFTKGDYYEGMKVQEKIKANGEKHLILPNEKLSVYDVTNMCKAGKDQVYTLSMGVFDPKKENYDHHFVVLTYGGKGQYAVLLQAYGVVSDVKSDLNYRGDHFVDAIEISFTGEGKLDGLLPPSAAYLPMKCEELTAKMAAVANANWADAIAAYNWLYAPHLSQMPSPADPNLPAAYAKLYKNKNAGGFYHLVQQANFHDKLPANSDVKAKAKLFFFKQMLQNNAKAKTAKRAASRAAAVRNGKVLASAMPVAVAVTDAERVEADAVESDDADAEADD